MRCAFCGDATNHKVGNQPMCGFCIEFEFGRNFVKRLEESNA